MLLFQVRTLFHAGREIADTQLSSHRSFRHKQPSCPFR